MNNTSGHDPSEYGPGKSPRNPNGFIGGNPNETPEGNVALKYLKIVEQRERILESFLAEHAGLKPSQIRQIVTELDNGDVAWHVEKIQ